MNSDGWSHNRFCLLSRNAAIPKALLNAPTPLCRKRSTVPFWAAMPTWIGLSLLSWGPSPQDRNWMHLYQTPQNNRNGTKTQIMTMNGYPATKMYGKETLREYGDCCRCNGLATPCINLAGQYWSILHLAKMHGTSFQGPHCTEITFSCTTWRFFINKMLRQSMANCHYKRKEHLFDACVAHHDVLKVFLTAWYYLDKVAALPSEQEPFYLTCTNLPKEPWPVLLHLLPVARMAVQCSIGCGVVALSGRTLRRWAAEQVGLNTKHPTAIPHCC